MTGDHPKANSSSSEVPASTSTTPSMPVAEAGPSRPAEFSGNGNINRSSLPATPVQSSEQTALEFNTGCSLARKSTRSHGRAQSLSSAACSLPTSPQRSQNQHKRSFPVTLIDHMRASSVSATGCSSSAAAVKPLDGSSGLYECGGADMRSGAQKAVKNQGPGQGQGLLPPLPIETSESLSKSSSSTSLKKLHPKNLFLKKKSSLPSFSTLLKRPSAVSPPLAPFLPPSSELSSLSLSSQALTPPMTCSSGTFRSPASEKYSDLSEAGSIIGNRTHEWGSTGRLSFERSRLRTPVVNDERNSLEMRRSPDEPSRFGDGGVEAAALGDSESVNEPNEPRISESQDDSQQDGETVGTVETVEGVNARQSEEADVEDAEAEAEGEDESDGSASVFSFEQNKLSGRNASIKYYKQPSEIEAGSSQRNGRNQAQIPSTLLMDYDEEFDEELNVFDSDDDFEDVGHLYNNDFFGDEEEQPRDDGDGQEYEQTGTRDEPFTQGEDYEDYEGDYDDDSDDFDPMIEVHHVEYAYGDEYVYQHSIDWHPEEAGSSQDRGEESLPERFASADSGSYDLTGHSDVIIDPYELPVVRNLPGSSVVSSELRDSVISRAEEESGVPQVNPFDSREESVLSTSQQDVGAHTGEFVDQRSHQQNGDLSEIMEEEEEDFSFERSERGEVNGRKSPYNGNGRGNLSHSARYKRYGTIFSEAALSEIELPGLEPEEEEFLGRNVQKIYSVPDSLDNDVVSDRNSMTLDDEMIDEANRYPEDFELGGGLRTRASESRQIRIGGKTITLYSSRS